MLNGGPSEFEAFRLTYYAEWDTLYLRSEQNPPAASIPVGRIGWLRYDSQSLEIVGADVEDFEGEFLVTHPFLREDWRMAKPLVFHVGTRRLPGPGGTAERPQRLRQEPGAPNHGLPHCAPPR